MSSIKLGLAGSSGYWAKNLIKTIKSLNYDLVATCDLNDEKLEGIEHYTNFDKFLKHDCDAIIIATPPNFHYKMVRAALESNRSIWCEKPLTLSSQEANLLEEISRQNKKILHVDDTWIYHEDLRFIKNCLQLNRFGKVLSCKMKWLSWGKFQAANVFWDLGSHTIANAFHLFGLPNWISATGTTQEIEKKNVYVDGNINLDYGPFKVNSEVSWISDKKIRNLTIITDQGTLETDFTGQVDFIERGGAQRKIFHSQNLGTPLQVAMIHFVESVKENQNTWSSGLVGARVVKVIERAIMSANAGGTAVKND